MKVSPLSIPGVIAIEPIRHHDDRGYLFEAHRASAFRELGIDTTFIQSVQTVSEASGTVRGLHYQSPPHAQAKLVWAVRGAIFDVALDMRRDSPAFGRHATIELDDQKGTVLYMPAGIAHGFCTLRDDTIVLYKVSAEYHAASAHGILWCDEALEIDWPIARDDAIVSQTDRHHPRWSAVGSPF